MGHYSTWFAKFIGHYIAMIVFCELGIGTKDTLWKVLDLYKKKHPKHQTFTFTHACYLLENIPNGLTCKKKRRRHHH